MGVLNAIQTRRANLRERREHRRQSQKSDPFLSDEKEILEHVLRFPGSCSRKYSFEGHHGKHYPLFVVACRPNVSLELVQTVHEAYPQAIPEALHYVLCHRQKSLPVIQYLLNHTPDQSLARYRGSLPLHTALSHQAKLNIIQYLVDQYPGAVKERESKNNRLPLHIAIEHFAALNVIKFLVSKYKEALNKADYDIISIVEEEGWLVHKGKYTHDIKCGLPLHAACKRRGSLQLIHFLVCQYPNAVSTKNRAGWLPLHYACAYGAQPIVIEYLITCCPDSLLERTNFMTTEYPTHLACGKPDADLETVKLLVGKHPLDNHGKPKETIYNSYMDDAHRNEAHPIVVRFLRSVALAAAKGYSYIPTQEERFQAHTRQEEATVSDNKGTENATDKAEASSESSIRLGQVIRGS